MPRVTVSDILIHTSCNVFVINRRVWKQNRKRKCPLESLVTGTQLSIGKQSLSVTVLSLGGGGLSRSLPPGPCPGRLQSPWENLFLNKQGQQDALQPSASPRRGPWKRLSVHPSVNGTVWLQWFRWNGLVRTVWFEPVSVGMVWLVPAMWDCFG
jgi:hypothetical protein